MSMSTTRRWPRACALAVLSCLTPMTAAQAAPVTLEFSGTVFSVTDPSDVFVTTSPNTYSLFITWDPDLLVGMPSGAATIYETAPGETSITFSFLSGAGDSFVSDNSFPVRIAIENTPPLDPMMPMPGTGEDRFSIQGHFAANLTLSLFMVESHFGTNPLSSNDLPTTGFGIGPGTWSTSELDIDRTDVFANISGSVANIEEVTSVPEPSTLALCSIGMLVLGVGLRTRKLKPLRIGSAVVMLAMLATDGTSVQASLDETGDQIWGQHSPFVEGAAEAFDRFGSAVATGDFNGDGRDDLAVGSPRESVDGLLRAGAVNVIYGANGGLDVVGDQIWTQDSPNVQGVAEADDRFGFALAVGDFDGNGYDDLAVGAPFETVVKPGEAFSAANAGAVNVFYGGPSGLTADFDQIWTQDSTGVTGVAESYDRLGHALAAGDFNGDGFDDLAIGAPGENIGGFPEGYCGPGAVNVLYGSAVRLSATADQIWTQDSTGVDGVAEDYECFGRAVAAGDFDGDGFDDLAIGVPAPTVLTTRSALIVTGAGVVNVLYGTANGLSAAGDQIWGQASGGVAGAAEDGDQFGWALAAGDLNGDGYDDLAIGVPHEGVDGEIGGAVNVLYGSPGGLDSSGDQIWHQDSTGVLGEASTDDLAAGEQDAFASYISTGAFGSALTIGDFNGDGFDDLAIGVPGENVGAAADAGAVNVLYGSAGGLTAAGDQLWHQESAGVSGIAEVGDLFGSALAAGDFDGDGNADLAIGVPGESVESIPEGTNAGVVQVLYGG